MPYKPFTVLFLSTGNAARSILAEAILRERGSERFSARSAGYRPLLDVNPHTLALLASEGISINGLHCKGWGEFLAAANLLPIDVIVTLSEEARANCPTWPGLGVTSRRLMGIEGETEDSGEITPGPVRVHWPVDDPLSADKADVMEWKYHKVFATLEARIARLIKTRLAHRPEELLLQFKDIGMVV